MSIIEMTQKRQENLVYTVIWTIAFLLPLVVQGRNSDIASTTSYWKDVIHSWLVFFLPLFTLFLIHNFLLAPLLVNKGKKWQYAVLTILLLSAFFAFVKVTDNTPGDVPRGPMPELRMDKGNPRPEMRHDQGLDEGYPGPGNENRPAYEPGKRLEHGRPEDIGNGRKPIRPLSPSIVMMMFGLLVIGANLAIKMFFKSLEDERKFRELEKENMNSQMQFLRYQISPHFFMNTLNNIHALVDIDSEQAKDSILQLSKLMRYVLYEGDKPTIPLEKEKAFLEEYNALMRLRYNDSVRITLDVPAEVPNVEVPPLLLISFVENAFKHGISYNDESFVDVSMRIEGSRLLFTCKNSRHEEQKDDRIGIGMENTRKRLDLLYGKDYTLDVDIQEKTYSIKLDMPTKPVEEKEA